MDILVMNELSRDLIPDESNIIKKRIKRKKNKKPDKTDDKVVKPALQAFEDLDPFKNCKSFIYFYRQVLRGVRPTIKFFSFESEINYGLTLMDVLKDADKWENIDFLRSWIKYFSTYHLKGKSIINPKRTSLKEFTKTFEEYNGKYIGK